MQAAEQSAQPGAVSLGEASRAGQRLKLRAQAPGGQAQTWCPGQAALGSARQEPKPAVLLELSAFAASGPSMK